MVEPPVSAAAASEPDDLPSSLLEAAKAGDLASVQRFFDEKTGDLRARDAAGWSALTWAACNGHVHVVMFLVEQGAVDAEAEQKTTAEASTTEQGEEEEEELAPVTRVCTTSPLHWAAYKGHAHVVWTLLLGGMSPLGLDSEQNTPLHLASSGGHLAIVKTLLSVSVGEQPVSVKAKNVYGNAAMQVARTVARTLVIAHARGLIGYRRARGAGQMRNRPPRRPLALRCSAALPSTGDPVSRVQETLAGGLGGRDPRAAFPVQLLRRLLRWLRLDRDLRHGPRLCADAPASALLDGVCRQDQRGRGGAAGCDEGTLRPRDARGCARVSRGHRRLTAADRPGQHFAPPAAGATARSAVQIESHRGRCGCLPRCAATATARTRRRTLPLVHWRYARRVAGFGPFPPIPQPHPPLPPQAQISLQDQMAEVNGARPLGSRAQLLPMLAPLTICRERQVQLALPLALPLPSSHSPAPTPLPPLPSLNPLRCCPR